MWISNSMLYHRRKIMVRYWTWDWAMFSQMSSLRCAFFHHCRQQWPRMRGHLSVQKRIKSYFRSTMVQERLNGLAIFEHQQWQGKVARFFWCNWWICPKKSTESISECEEVMTISDLKFRIQNKHECTIVFTASHYSTVLYCLTYILNKIACHYLFFTNRSSSFILFYYL